MGLANREGGKYITIMGGKFTMRVDASTPGATPRINKKGNTVHEMHYDSFTGKLLNIRRRASEFGPQLEFDFVDGGDIYTLQLSASSSQATNLLKILPNADLAEEMKVQPSQKIEDGKTKSSLFVSQNGVTLKHAYTKENPNGMPQMEQITVKGQLVWDDTKRLEFLMDMMERDILPKLPKSTPSSESGSSLEDEFDDPLNGRVTGSNEDDDF